MKKIQIGRKNFALPDRWSDCTPEQIQELLPLQLIAIDQQKPGKVAALKWNAIQYLLNAPDKLLEKLDTEQRWRLMRLGGWIWTDRIRHKPFESFTFDGVVYLLPSPGFANTSSIEVALTNIQYMAFSRTKNPDQNAVFSIVATLCRPVRPDLEAFRASNEWDNDERERYNTTKADERAAAFQKGNLPVGIIMAVLQYFEQSNNLFLNAYKTVYDQADPDEKPLYQNGEGIVTTLMDIAKTGTFGDFDKVCGQNAHTIWLFLRDQNLKIHRANEQAERDADD